MNRRRRSLRVHSSACLPPIAVQVGRFETLESRTLLSTASSLVLTLDDLTQAPELELSLGRTTTTNGTLAQPGDFALFRIDPTINGLLTVQVHAPGMPIGLSLIDDRGEALVQSDGLSLADPDVRIVQHVLPGTHFLKVEPCGGEVGSGAYTSTSSFVRANHPSESVPAGPIPDSMAIADLNGDGKDDFVFANEGTDSVTVDYGQTSTVVGDRGRGVLAPGAVSLADMNGDGLADLVVANSGSNNLLVYPGIGGGQFGPALNDGKGFAAGTNPTGFSLADLNGDALPDVVVANVGSNDVSVLLSRGLGDTWSLDAGPRLKVGTGPVATALQDITGDGILDLVVTNSGSNDVYILPGVGGGSFDDTRPRVLRVGATPVQSVVGDFNGDGRPDLTTINSGSSTLTFFTGLDTSNPLAQTFGSGGLRPTVGLSGDFNLDGRLDLLVGNSGDGRLALFFGSQELTLAATLTSLLVPSPTGLAFDELNEGILSFYARSEGRDAAVQLAIDLVRGYVCSYEPPASPPLPDVPDYAPASSPSAVLDDVGLRLRWFAPDSPTYAWGSSPFDVVYGPGSGGQTAPVSPTLVQVPQLLPLGGSSLALGATLLTVAAGTELAVESGGEVPSDGATTLVQLVTASALPPQTLVDPGKDAVEGGIDGDELKPKLEEELEWSTTTLAAMRVVFGLEEAWDEARRDARELFPGESGEGKRPGRGTAVVFAVDAVLTRWSPWCDLLAPASSATLRLAARAEAALMEAMEIAGRSEPSPPPPPATSGVASGDGVELTPSPEGAGPKTAAVALALIAAADQARRRRGRRKRTTALGSGSSR